MRNKYPGICYRCGNRVEKGAGHFERYKRGWRTQHATCAIKYRGTDKGTHDVFKEEEPNYDDRSTVKG